MQTLPISISTERLADFCRQHGIVRLALFGSVLRDDFRPESDVDLLVQFAPGREVGLIRFLGLQRQLGEIIGRRVDLNTAEDLSKYFVDEVMREALPIYVAT